MRPLAEPTSFFPFGTQYYCPPTPLPDEWDADFGELSSAGYTHVQFRVLWRWYERHRGRFAWEELDRIFDRAHQHGLRVILKPMLENAPDWVFTQLDSTRIGFHGIPLTRFAMNSAYYAGGFMPCFDKPRVVEAAATFVRALAQRYGGHPALWYYDAWNEPRSRPLGQCQCEHSAASYRRWLEATYGDIESLNRALYKAWTSYEAVIPPVSHADLVEMFLWRQWAAWAVSQQVRFVCEAIRWADPDARIAVHVGAPSVVQDPACDTSDDLLNVEPVDRYGTSLNITHYPSTPIEHNQAEYFSSWLRRVDPAYWCHEFRPNESNWSRSTPAKTLIRQLWMAIAGGCSALTFWEYRSVRMGIRSNGFGMRALDGGPTDRSRACDAVAAVLHERGERLAQTRRAPSPVALLYSRRSDLILRLQQMQTYMGDAQTVRPDVGYWYKRAARAAHVAYQGNGKSVDWAVPGDGLAAADVLHVTAAEMIDADTADWLRQYVRGGGRLVVEYPFACRDEKTWLALRRPHHALEDLVGCTEGERVVTLAGRPDVATFVGGHQIRPEGWRIDLVPAGGEPMAHWQDGAVAALRHRYGEGEVFVLGASAALAFTDRWDDPVFDLFGWLLEEAGCSRGPAESPDRQVWIRRRRASAFELWFICNVADRPRQLDLPAGPVAVWHACDAELARDRTVELGPGGVLVAEMAPLADA